MTANYYTLAALIREISPLLVGARFLEAYSHRPNELRLRFDRGTLVALLRPIDGALFLSTAEEKKPRSNIRSFFEPLAGLGLGNVAIAASDREIALAFPDAELKLRFFGAPNAVLVREGKVIESFKKQTEQAATITTGSKLGKRYTKEVAERAKANGTAEEQAIQALERELATASSAIIYRKSMSDHASGEVLLSLTSLISLNEWQPEEYSSVNEAIRRTVIERAKGRRVTGIRTELLRRIDAEHERHYRARSDMRQGVENSRRAERYAAIANTLLMHAHEIVKGAEEIVLDIEDTPQKIALDSAMNAYENAGRYFERAKNSLKARDELQHRVEATTKEIARLSREKDEILKMNDEALLDRRSSFTDRGRSAHLSSLPKEAPRFREFTVAGGMKVLVGRNAKQNDELTTRIAKKEDVWLHARGVPGSHVVLQVGGRKDVPKEAIVQAAEIAAWFSDARTQPLAPVSYTRRKYVRKPRRRTNGAPADPGAVVMEREEVVMVTPKEP